jgi:hypothetical protein
LIKKALLETENIHVPLSERLHQSQMLHLGMRKTELTNQRSSITSSNTTCTHVKKTQKRMPGIGSFHAILELMVIFAVMHGVAPIALSDLIWTIITGPREGE